MVNKKRDKLIEKKIHDTHKIEEGKQAITENKTKDSFWKDWKHI